MHRTASSVLGRSWLIRWLCCFAALWGARLAHAEPVESLVPGGPTVEVPKELIPWVPWVKDSVTEGLCPKLGEQEQCSWPGLFSIAVGREGADFSFEVFLEIDGWVTLPGSEVHWPEAVEAAGKSVAVLSKDGLPVVRLPAGGHRLVGRYVWEKAPETLAVPNNVGLLRLEVEGRSIDFPRREENGALWLQAGSTSGQDASDRVELEVFRRVDDGIPLGVKTQLVLHVSGKTREVRLLGAALTESRAVSIESPIPTRFEPDGTLVLHAHAGEHRVILGSLFPTPPERLVLPAQAAPWPEHETWIFVPNNSIRQVEVSGAPGIDAAQTNLPEEWKSHQAFLVSKDKGLVFQTKRRGQPEPPPNQLSVARQYWLDLDGKGFTAKDRVTGTLNRDFRLDLAGAALGHVAMGNQDLLVTRGPSGNFGVELRQPKIDLMAEWRTPRKTSAVPAVGYKADLGSLSATLHLPPGWDVLHVSGVDTVSDTWWSEWTLWGFFYVLLVAIAVGRLFGPKLGGLALATLVVTHGRDDSPMAFWAILLVFLALLRLVPGGWFRRILRLCWLGVAIGFAAVSVDFAVGEVRGAFFPSTHPPAGAGYGLTLMRSAEPEPMEMDKMAAMGAPAQAVARSAKLPDVAEMSLDLRSSGKARQGWKGKRLAQQGDITVDPNAVVQTGPGLPTWQWKRINLGWSGPVRQDQELNVYLTGPVSNGILGVLRVLGVALLGFFLVRRTPFGPTPEASSSIAERKPRSAAPLVAGLLLACLFLVTKTVHAQPSTELLGELKTRLTRAPDCTGCLEVESLELSLVGHSLDSKALVHVGRLTDYRLPGPARSWSPSKVTVDGKPTSALLLGSDGFLHVRLENGRHQVQASGPVSGNELVISPGSPPHRVTVKSEGWSVDGLREGRVENTLHLTLDERPKKGDGTAQAPATNRLPAWLLVTRTLELGVTWRLTTDVERQSPTGEPVSLRYSLLPGEEITTSNALVEQGQLVVALGRDDQRVSYQSVLRPSDTLSLTAATQRPFIEEWRVRCSALYHCEYSGLAPYQRTEKDEVVEKFRPLPGETLGLKVNRPPAAPGASHTIERAAAVFTPGKRLLSGNLQMTIKVSKAYTQTVKLQPGSVVQQLSVNGQPEPIRMRGNLVELSLQPGQWEVQLVWHEPRPQALLFFSPELDLGSPAVNATVEVKLQSDRWLLFTLGPSWGPKVLLWSYVLLLLASAWILVRIPGNPLKLWQWMVLGLGLTQVPVPIALMIAAWFFLLALRGNKLVERVWLKRLTQLALGFYSLVFLGCLCGAVYDGLVSNPDMRISGAIQGGQMDLTWYQDRVTGKLPVGTVLSVPVVVFRLLNLGWALWLAFSLLGWLRWGWSQYAKGGLWAFQQKPLFAPMVTPPIPEAPPPPAPAGDPSS